LPLYAANEMVENVLGTVQLPFAVATNFTVNGRDVLVPMATEEPSVVAAASYGAKLARSRGGFRARAPAPVMLGQILLVGPTLADGSSMAATVATIDAQAARLVELGNALQPSLRQRGGGVQRIEARPLTTWRGLMLVVHVHVDVRDSMGANTVTTICEKLAPHLEELTGATARMRILSNLCPDRLFEAEAVWTREELAASAKGLGLTGDEVVDAMLDASAFAEADPYRACTHNKGLSAGIMPRTICPATPTLIAAWRCAGIMNGVDAVALATMNDCRAIESGAHAYAATSTTGQYGPLTRYEKTEDGHLRGTIRLPLALGVRGTSEHAPLACARCVVFSPCAQTCRWRDWVASAGAAGAQDDARRVIGRARHGDGRRGPRPEFCCHARARDGGPVPRAHAPACQEHCHLGGRPAAPHRPRRRHHQRRQDRHPRPRPPRPSRPPRRPPAHGHIDRMNVAVANVH
jgi:hydroxymethylglutaryl-CoA reductase